MEARERKLCRILLKDPEPHRCGTFLAMWVSIGQTFFEVAIIRLMTSTIVQVAQQLVEGISLEVTCTFKDDFAYMKLLPSLATLSKRRYYLLWDY